jgi:hypothetical protein
MVIPTFRLVLLFLLLTLSNTVIADKTDVVVLKNGDKITGEVKGLERGKLEFSTDSMGTVFIDWVDIQAILSDTGQSVELTNGQRFYGPLNKPEDADMMQIETEQGTVGVSTIDVVTMYPVESTFWERLDLSASLGFSWDKASDVGRYTIGGDAEYRDPRFVTQAGFSGEITTLDEADDTRRFSANALHMQFRENKRFTAYFATVERNDELGIQLRTLAGAGYGWVPVRSNNNWFFITAGLDINHETPFDAESETNLEGVGMISYEYFRYSDPERSFKTSLTVFPSITDFGRWRADFDTDLDIEFIKDFSWVLGFFARYDSDPLSEEASSSDYGVTSTLKYDF